MGSSVLNHCQIVGFHTWPLINLVESPHPPRTEWQRKTISYDTDGIVEKGRERRNKEGCREQSIARHLELKGN
jgi:hypothetical protein